MKQKRKKLITLVITWIFCLCITSVKAQVNYPTSSSSIPESITTLTCNGSDDKEKEEPDPTIRILSVDWLRTILGLE